MGLDEFPAAGLTEGTAGAAHALGNVRSTANNALQHLASAFFPPTPINKCIIAHLIEL